MATWERKRRIEGYLSSATLPSGLRSGQPVFLIKESSIITLKTGLGSFIFIFGDDKRKLVTQKRKKYSQVRKNYRDFLKLLIIRL